MLAVPRVFEKVYNSARQRARSPSGKGKIFDAAARTAERLVARARPRRGAADAQAASTRLFDRLVYAKLRAALGGRCVAAISGGAPLGERLGHFFRGVGVTDLRGLRADRDDGRHLRQHARRTCASAPSAGRPAVPSVRIADDGELLVTGGMVFRGYWGNPDATSEAIDADGWFHTGDIGEIDDDGFVRITGRKKELIVTAAGKNVAPAVLEDRVRAHWLVGQALVVGDRQPFIAALVTIDPEAFPQWLASTGRPADTAAGRPGRRP